VASINSILHGITNFLFSRANKEFLIFLSFLALAGVFWIMMTLNETYEQEVRIVLGYTNVPKNALITSGETDTLRVTVSDKGFNILTYVFSKNRQPVGLDFSRYAKTNGTGTVPGADLKKIAVKELPASAKVISVKPDKLVFYYNNGESKRVPVKWQGQVLPQQLYFIAETLMAPDSVTVYASKACLDSLNTVYTQELNYTDVNDTLTIETLLRPIAGAKMVPDRVTISFITDVLTEVRIDGISVEGINMPEGKVLRTFPSKVSVKFVTGMKNYQSLKAEDFRVVADYKAFSQSRSSKCKITLAGKPEGISNAKLETNQVDYLIEELTP
jgi:YbbR domain-containing protein